jgi:hypothetical protein
MLLALLATLADTACSEHSQSSTSGSDHHYTDAADLDAPTSTSSDATLVDGSGQIIVANSFQDAGGSADAALLVTPPSMACDGDASIEAGGDYCPPPLSMCADDKHLAYFDWGTCVAGSCVWPQKVLTCYSGYCSSGACISNITAPVGM